MMAEGQSGRLVSGSKNSVDKRTLARVGSVMASQKTKSKSQSNTKKK